MKKLFTINLILILSLVGLSASGLTITSVATGSFDSTAVWNCACIPGGEDDVTIDDSDTITLSSNISINNLSINSTGILDAGSFNITVTGNWSNSGTFDEQTNKVTFSGSIPQSITNINDETFYNLTIDKTGGDVTLDDSTDVTITNTLTLTNGDIIIESNLLIMEVNSAIAGSPGSTSCIQAHTSGKMRKKFNSTGSFTFPVGDNDEYSPFTFILNSATFSGDDFIAVNLTDSKHINLFAGDHITRYWSIKSGGFPVINYDLSYQYVDADIVGTESNLLSARWAAASWIWSSFDSIDTATNTLSRSGIIDKPQNHDFTGGSSTTLVIEMLYFDAKADNDRVVLTWATATEINNDFFTIERSSDGNDFEPINIVQGAGNSYNELQYSRVDNNPLHGRSYYRLKQTDFDGKFSYSPVRSIQFEGFDGRTGLKVFPNPSNGERVNIFLDDIKDYEAVTFLVYDISGRMIFSKEVLKDGGVIAKTIDFPEKLLSGIYLAVVRSEEEIYKKKLIVR